MGLRVESPPAILLSREGGWRECQGGHWAIRHSHSACTENGGHGCLTSDVSQRQCGAYRFKKVDGKVAAGPFPKSRKMCWTPPNWCQALRKVMKEKQ